MDLRSFLESKLTIEWKDGKTLHCPSISMAQFTRLTEAENKYIGKDDIKFIEIRNKELLHFLNSNDEGVKITKEELEELPVQYLAKLCYYIMLDAYGQVSDPN